MPTYVYSCPVCGEYELIQRMSENALDECPQCKSEVKRVPQPVGISFVGKGFYSTENPKR